MIAGEMMHDNFVSVTVGDLVQILDLVVFSTTKTKTYNIEFILN